MLFIASTLSISVNTGLGSHLIDAITTLGITGQTQNGKVQPGDCFVITRDSPYKRSNVLHNDPSTFYAPFKDITPVFETGSVINPASTVAKVAGSDTSIEITVSATATATDSYSYKIKSIRNPYSATHDVKITVQHYVNCVKTTATDLTGGNKPTLGPSVFKTNNGALSTPTAAIMTATGGNKNIVAS